MTDLKKTITKGTLGTVAAGAMALASATPAMAQDRHRDRGIDAGDVIAGAVIIGGIAALAGAFKGDRKDRVRNTRHNTSNPISAKPTGAPQRIRVPGRSGGL